MGKSRGRGGGARPKKTGRPPVEEEEMDKARALGQSSNAGMLPPSDSEDESPAPRRPAGQPITAGMLPPSDSEDDDEDDDEDESESEEEDAPRVGRPAVPASEPRKKKDDEDEIDPEEVKKNLERLSLARKKREEDRQRRIVAEGWDRYAPVTETNKPPNAVPADHPSRKADT